MSDTPAATEADKLAPPPPKPARSNSSASNRSNSTSRRGHRSPGSSASVSRSNSHSSQGNGSSAPRKGANTTTISGGTSLGGGGKASEHQRTRTKGGAADAGSRSLSRRSSTKQGPQRPSSATTDRSSADKPERAVTPSDQSKVRSIHTATSPPIDAMEAAVTAATKKHHETHGQDALSSLQRMISDLKAISPSSSNPGSRQVSGKMPDSPQSPASGSAAPVAIPGATSPTATTSTKLKADAPSFTPGSLRTGQSPTAPTSQPPPPQARLGSGNANRRGQSVSYGFNQNFAPPGFPAGHPHFPLADVQPGQSVDFSQFTQHAEVFQQQQQLLAAQQLQLQLLQAQLVQQQMASQQQQRDTGFIAPRFQALAAQRAALQQQQQQQSAQMAEAQRVFELQQQQMLLAQQQPIPETAPVFEEDSPEHSPAGAGPTGRPQLNPNFTFGKRRESSSDKPAVVVDRSAGVGGAAATGLAGLAARAHKRSGSDMNQQDTEQVS